MGKLTREQYHQRRLNKATAEAMNGFYNEHNDESHWEPWEFEAEQKLLDNVKQRICREDGFDK